MQMGMVSWLLEARDNQDAGVDAARRSGQMPQAVTGSIEEMMFLIAL